MSRDPVPTLSFPKILTFASRVPGAVIDAVGDAADTLSDAGGDAGGGVMVGINLVDNVSSVFTRLVSVLVQYMA